MEPFEKREVSVLFGLFCSVVKIVFIGRIVFFCERLEICNSDGEWSAFFLQNSLIEWPIGIHKWGYQKDLQELI